MSRFTSGGRFHPGNCRLPRWLTRELRRLQDRIRIAAFRGPQSTPDFLGRSRPRPLTALSADNFCR